MANFKEILAADGETYIINIDMILYIENFKTFNRIYYANNRSFDTKDPFVSKLIK
ncbi:hypothetical protein [Myroides odoratimimus]|uniref:hypothetical protein n=1 Tax=Myroides odoratimimus TaxID=76832 RepID=UPI000AB91F14|nr:hypothetical protein [Myroides odoratimimus]